MSDIKYNGYLIRPSTFQIEDSGEWSLELYIGKDKNYEYAERKFWKNESFKTKTEAVNQCINFGKMIIDGNVSNCTVLDL